MAYPTRFIVLCHARTGSTLLGSLLGSHPAIDYRDEQFKRYRAWRGLKSLARPVVWRYPLLRLKWMAGRGTRTVFGCKLAPYYVRNIGRAVAQVHGQGWLIVHLQRRNLFREAISAVTAKKTKRYKRQESERAKGSAGPHLEIAPADLLARFEAICRWNKLEQDALAKIPHVALVYEDELANTFGWDAAAGRVFEALGLEQAPVHTTVRPTWDRPYSEIVVNYAELVETVRASDYARFLEDAA